MVLWIAGVAFGLIVCYAVFLVAVAVIQRYRRKPIFTVYRKGLLILMTTDLSKWEIRKNDKIGRARVRWHYKMPDPIDGE